MQDKLITLEQEILEGVLCDRSLVEMSRKLDAWGANLYERLGLGRIALMNMEILKE